MLTWIMATLGAGVLMPNVLRWYWGRLNGWGYFAGSMSGMALSLIQALLENAKLLSLPVYVTFPALALAVLAITVIVTLCTPPTDAETLKWFYRHVQPAGAWGAAARLVQAEDPAFRKETPFAIDLFNVCIAVVWLVVLYVTPVLVVINQLRAAAIGTIVLAVLTGLLLLTWRTNLPPREAAEE